MKQKSLELWSVLEIFWGKERVAECQNILFGHPDLILPEGKTLVNTLGNLITLSNQAHSYWNDGIFALKHIRGGSAPANARGDVEDDDLYVQTKTGHSHKKTIEMELELVWLAKHPELTRVVRIDQIVDDRSITESDGPHGLMNMTTEPKQILYSGHQITLTTSDPQNLPLPDERLIELQWLLARVLRMSGAGEDKDMEYDDSPSISPVASLVSSRTESLAESPPNSPPTQSQ
jgi:hypothetical protein